ncbi:hypothetical protein [Dickeya zeae]|nr:hypothetical protein [Dickeya zeae]UJR54313.1 hypothetical protein J417_09850 [Dickeya zeae MS1]
MVLLSLAVEVMYTIMQSGGSFRSPEHGRNINPAYRQTAIRDVTQRTAPA